MTSASTTSTPKRLAIAVAVAIASVVLTLLAIEAGLRAFGDVDGDGLYAGYRLRPDYIDLEQIEASLRRYLEQGDSARLVYDEMVGWHYRENAALKDGRFTTQAAGYRAPRAYDQDAPPDTLRIVVLGDSFAADVDVTDDESWGMQIERALTESGLSAQVLNFGVEAYGMDQAYLRWQHNARAYSPDIVIFGVQPENINRNVNMFRVLRFSGTGIPLAKPRFILTEAGLELINQPTPPPEALMDIYRDFDNFALAEHEFFYDRHQLRSNWWSNSYLLVLLNDARRLQVTAADEYSPDSERVRLGIALIDAMAADVTASGAHFLTAYLPRRSLLRAYHDGQQSPYHNFMQLVAERTHYVATEQELGPEHLPIERWGETGHYGPEISRDVGAVVAEEILACVTSGTCDFARRQALLRSQG